jgi:hypothetical protein
MARLVQRISLPAVVGCVWLSWFAVGCLDDAKSDGKDQPGLTMDAGAEPDEDSGASPDEPGSEGDGGESDVPSGAVAGTAILAECSSTQPPADGMCGGYYCGVDEATLTPVIDPESACGSDPAMVCSGELLGAVGACARMVKGAMPTASDETLRTMIEACVHDDPSFESVSLECLGCFLDAAACASEHCLVECLSGDNATCDLCEIENDCTRPVFACAGLPDPF